MSKDVEHNKINNEKRGEVYKATKRMLQAQGQPQAQSQPQAAIEQTQNLNAFGVSNTNLSMTGPTQDPQNSGFNIHPAALGHVDPRFPEFPTAGNLTQDDIAMNMNNFIYPERVPDPVEPGPLQAFQSLPTAPAAATVAPGLSNAGSGPWLQQPNAVVRQQGPAVAPNMAPSLKRYRDQDDEVDHEVVKKGKTNTLAAVQAATLANAVKVPRRKKSKAPVASSTTAQTTGQVQPAQVPAKTGNTGKAGEAHTDGKDVKGTKGRK